MPDTVCRPSKVLIMDMRESIELIAQAQGAQPDDIMLLFRRWRLLKLTEAGPSNMFC